MIVEGDLFIFFHTSDFHTVKFGPSYVMREYFGSSESYELFNPRGLLPDVGELTAEPWWREADGAVVEVLPDEA